MQKYFPVHHQVTDRGCDDVWRSTEALAVVLTPQQVAPRLIDAGADISARICGGGPELLFKITTSMVGHGKPVMAQPNAGQPALIEGRSIYVANPEYFGVCATPPLESGRSCHKGDAVVPHQNTSNEWQTQPHDDGK